MRRVPPLWLLSLVALACGPTTTGETPPPVAPSDDPFDYDVDPTVEYRLEVGAPRFVIPARNLPAQAPSMASNNNVDIILFQDRLFLAWRTGPNHFASEHTVMNIISSRDLGQSWEFEHSIAMGTDVREPRFLLMDGVLRFHWFEGGTNPLGFEPRQMWRIHREGFGKWSAAETFGPEKEVPWSMQVRRGVAYLTSYAGNHYDQSGESNVEVYFKRSTDGLDWQPVNPERPVVYRGGVSEVAFEFDLEGNLWTVTRNEDGDATGFGSHVCFAPASDLSAWECPAECSPERYDSPWMFRHGKEIYLVARRDVGGPFDQNLEGMTFNEERIRYLVDYWNRPKRTAIYKIDQQARAVVHLMDLPSAGDTAFPSVRRLGAHRFILANYTSPLDDPDISWIDGQGSVYGTLIYLMELEFRPE